MSGGIRIFFFLILSLFCTGCGLFHHRVFLNYHDVNEMGQQHPAHIHLVQDSTNYVGTSLTMTFDSSTWVDSGGSTHSVATSRINKAEFVVDKTEHALASGVLFGLTLSGVGLLAHSLPVGILGFGVGLIAGIAMPDKVLPSNVFQFYPDPFVGPLYGARGLDTARTEQILAIVSRVGVRCTRMERKSADRSFLLEAAAHCSTLK